MPEGLVKVGDKWTTKNELTTALGKAQQTTEYRYVGEPEGQIEVVTNLKLDSVGPATKKLSLREHKQTGVVQFDSAAGRLKSAEQTQTLVTERPYRETTIVVTLKTVQKTEVKPAPTFTKASARG